MMKCSTSGSRGCRRSISCTAAALPASRPLHKNQGRLLLANQPFCTDILEIMVGYATDEIFHTAGVLIIIIIIIIQHLYSAIVSYAGCRGA